MSFNITRTFPRSRWAVIFACMSMFVLGISDNIRGPLFPELLQHFSLTNSQGSLSFAFASTAAFFGNTLGAYSLKRIQLDRLLAASVFLMGCGLFAMGMAPSFAVYLLGAIIYGFSIGATGVTQNLLIAENTASTRLKWRSSNSKIFRSLMPEKARFSRTTGKTSWTPALWTNTARRVRCALWRASCTRFRWRGW